MNISRTLAPLSWLLAAAILAGCASEGAKPQAAPSEPVAAPSPVPAVQAPPQPVLAPDQAALKAGIDAYNNGEFNDAIKRLGGADIWSGASKATQLAALKYLAFSYCVTSRQALCRRQFEKAFKLDPGFDLAPGEHGHPLWEPMFERAKKRR